MPALAAARAGWGERGEGRDLDALAARVAEASLAVYAALLELDG